jgi:hypothetical protein
VTWFWFLARRAGGQRTVRQAIAAWMATIRRVTGNARLVFLIGCRWKSLRCQLIDSVLARDLLLSFR